MVGKTLHFGQGLTNSKNKKKLREKEESKSCSYSLEDLNPTALDWDVIGITLPQINSS